MNLPLLQSLVSAEAEGNPTRKAGTDATPHGPSDAAHGPPLVKDVTDPTPANADTAHGVPSSPKKRSLLTGSLRHALSERGDDLYETPEVAVRALLGVEHLPHFIWEPACGPGAIVKVLREAGHHVFGSDLCCYETPFQDAAGWDFLSETRCPRPSIEAIVTNPPFKLAHEFVAHALKLCPKVYMLLRLAFLESERRRDILDNGTLAHVHVFRKRIPMMHRAGWEGRKGSSAMAFAWFTWDRAHQGPTIIDRVSWEEHLHA